MNTKPAINELASWIHSNRTYANSELATLETKEKSVVKELEQVRMNISKYRIILSHLDGIEKDVAAPSKSEWIFVDNPRIGLSLPDASK